MNMHLTEKEEAIFNLLKENQGKVCSIDYIYKNIWGQTPFDCANIVMVHVRHLREKIESDPSHPTKIKTIRGEGYYYTFQ